MYACVLSALVLRQPASRNVMLSLLPIVGGVALTAEWGGYYFVPLCRRLAPRALAPAVGVGAALAFYLFYARLLHETLYKGQGACFDDAWECRESPGVSGALRAASQGS